jgi:hypothetical protein
VSPPSKRGHCHQGMYNAGIGATQENLEQVRAAWPAPSGLAYDAFINQSQ